MTPGDASGGEGWEERMQQALDAEVTPRRAEGRRLGEAVRLLIDRLVATAAPLDTLAQAADAVEQAASLFQGVPQGRLYEGFGESANAGDPYAFFDNSPMLGRANPVAPPIRMSVQDGVVRGEVRFGAAYEGPPGCVHGGYIAAAFDEVLGMTQSLTGHPGMTGTLTVRYRRPTPLLADLVFTGRIERREGRKIFTVGQAHHGDELTAEAEGLFISVDLARMAALHDARLQRDGTTGTA